MTPNFVTSGSQVAMSKRDEDILAVRVCDQRVVLQCDLLNNAGRPFPRLLTPLFRHSPKEKRMAPSSDNHGRESNRTVSENEA